MQILIYTSLIIAAYLLGSISSAIIVCRLMNLPDPRTLGSGNPGATNVLRIGGKKIASIALFGDMLKGLAPTLAAHLLGVPLLIIGLTALAAFLGHIYPIFFHFQGGKGVATLIGVLVGINWMLGLAAIVTWLFMVYVVKISSLSALVMSALVPVYSWYLIHDWQLTAILGFMVIVVFWRHRNNITRMMRGDESKIAKSNKSASMNNKSSAVGDD